MFTATILLTAGLVAGSVPLTVRETAGIDRVAEVAVTGVPLPRGWVSSVGELGLAAGGGGLVPAEFSPVASWPDGSLSWVQVATAVTVPAGGSVGFELVKGAGTGPVVQGPVSVVSGGGTVTVNTGTGGAVFVVGGVRPFEEVRIGSRVVVLGSEELAYVDDVATKRVPVVVRDIAVEHAGPLFARVVVRFSWGGALGLGGLRRYEFRRGSRVAILRQELHWEGSRCANGVTVCGGVPNGRLVDQWWRDHFTVATGGSRFVRVLAERGGVLESWSLGAGERVDFVQALRASRTAAQTYTVDSAPYPGMASGARATGGVMAYTGSGGGLVLGLWRMPDFEPQALRVSTQNRLTVDLAGKTWIGSRSGVYARLAVGAVDAGEMLTTESVLRGVWAPLHAPLRLWASAEAFQAAGVAVPVGPWPSYDAATAQVLDATVAKRQALGVFGTGVFGSWPRFWGSSQYGNEFANAVDPTPSETWDDAYWRATWTDYHNGSWVGVARAVRTGEVAWLDDVVEPAALRMLVTQMMQCADSDGYFYCGQAPTGYGGFRTDFNGSHAYWESLFWLYYLTGDSTIVSRVLQGAASMRKYLCVRRPESACLDGDAPQDPWAELTSRVASQWFRAFRFVGLASRGGDASYLEDWRSGLSRAVTQNYIEAGGYGFWARNRVTGPGRYPTDQVWMASLYDFENLWTLVEDGDMPLGSPSGASDGVLPSRIIAAWARTLKDYGRDAQGRWPNGLKVTFSGNQVGGGLVGVEPDIGGSDPYLYGTGRANLTAVLARGGETELATALADDTFTDSIGDDSPLGKVQALYFGTLHGALAALEGGGGSDAGVDAGVADTGVSDAGSSDAGAGSVLLQCSCTCDPGE